MLALLRRRRRLAWVLLLSRALGLAPFAPAPVRRPAEAAAPAPKPGSPEYYRTYSGTPGRGAFLEADWRGAWVSVDQRAQGAHAITTVHGEIPQSLIGGKLVRCGPANFERGGRRYEHVLDGDGFVLSIDFETPTSGRFQGRFVETRQFLAEEKAEAIIFRNTFGTQRGGGWLANAGDVKLKNVANTNVVAWGKKVLALWEAGVPHELDASTLETLGEWDPQKSEPGTFEGGGEMRGVTIDGGMVDGALDLARCFTAHPHVDPSAKRLVTFTWAQQPMLGEMRLEFVEHDSAWVEQQRVQHSMPGCTMAPHDFAITPSWHVFFENRMTMDLAQFIVGNKGPAQVLMMEPAKPCRLHLVRRDGSRAAVVVDVGPFFCIHTGVAYEDVDSAGRHRIVVMSSGWDLATGGSAEPRPFLGAWGGEMPNFDVIPPTWLFRTIVDAETGKLLSHRVLPAALEHCIEHPHVDPLREGAATAAAGGAGRAPPRYIYASLCNDVGLSSPPLGYARFDVRTQAVKTWYPETRTFCEELVVVPKDADADAALEDKAQVWLLGLTYSADKQTTSLIILDGADLESGPVCELLLPAVIPHGIHGSFQDARDK
ncbi:carotenoid oxygenase [Pelagophyceae sp. CCMP2097]|nr:carotenoid oxygenase [Pelagophyceae sp. CCMP2097]|mmetsp:Transcript_16874/g.57061  ORF Transcript_16874/g.57061 Transcript_16874/m.57061 type:complete len:599 (+) Transcript_16874:126-1922(+)